jgi:integrase
MGVEDFKVRTLPSPQMSPSKLSPAVLNSVANNYNDMTREDLREIIYHPERRLGAMLDTINKFTISNENKELLLKYHIHRRSRANPLTITKELRTILKLTTWFGKDWRGPVEEEDMDRLLATIEQTTYVPRGQNKARKLSPHTKRNYKKILKEWLRWLKKPQEIIDMIRYPRKIKSILTPQDLVTAEEIEKMINASTNIRDKCLLAVLIDSGCRPGEVLSLRLKDVEFDSYGALLHVDGRMGPRVARVVYATAYIVELLNTHALKNNPNAPLFIDSNYSMRVLSPSRMLKVLKDMAKAAGVTKRIYPYLLRHTRASLLSHVLADSDKRKLMGWVEDSDMMGIYEHIMYSQSDNQALAKLYKKKVEENIEVELPLAPRICSCGTESRIDKIICPKCNGYVSKKFESVAKRDIAIHDSIQISKQLFQIKGVYDKLRLLSDAELKKIITNLLERLEEVVRIDQMDNATSASEQIKGGVIL